MYIYETISDPVLCYECMDSAYNTSCGEPRTVEDLESLGTIQCKRGACIKWTYYKNRE